MITLHLEPTDLQNIRFAYSPLLELSMSYRVFKYPELHGLYAPWVEEVQRATYGVEFPYLDALVLARHYVTDFMTPTPTTTRLSLEDEIARLRDTPNEIIRDNIHRLHDYAPESDVRQFFLTYPREALECLIEEVRLYWQLALAHHWERIESVLENDVLYRARQMALNGVETMFGEINADVLRYERWKIVIDKPHDTPGHEKEVNLNGRGLQLVPAIFELCSGVSWQVVPEYQPMLIYNARGTGLWYSRELPEPEQALQVALGAGRAQVLQALQMPAHTSELAQRLNLTAGAVSQHLGRLAQAGLVESQRHSHRVYYRLSERGEKLMQLFGG